MEGTLEEVLECKQHIAIRWISLLQHGHTIPEYLESQEIRKVILYGINEFTLRILEEYRIVDRLHEIKAISDKKVTDGKVIDYYGISCVSPNNLIKYSDNDTITIITPMGWYKEIRRELENQGLKNVMTIQELIYDMCSNMNDNGE